ncbi:hypothetical protein D9M71_563770 [compost metagenome]
MLEAGDAAVDQAQQARTTLGQHEILAIAALLFGPGFDEATLEQSLLVLAGTGFQVVQVAHRLTLGGQRRGVLLGIRAWRKAVTGAVLHLVQQAFDQVPVVGDAHGYGLLLWTKGVHRLGPARVAKRSEALSACVVARRAGGARSPRR